ncbi:MAG: hypothetical protein V1822_02285 [Candidatus Micrarchaeota archaeon]
MMRKGQGAAEYLILLSIVLIVALIGIVLLGGLTSGNSNSMDSESHAYWSGQARPFAINEWVQIGDTMYMQVENKELARLVLTNISFDAQMKNLSGGGWAFGPSSKKNVSLGGFPTCNETTYDSYDYNVVFYYDSEDIPRRTQVGVKSVAGRCAFP